MSIKKVTRELSIVAYTDNGEPCCAKDFSKGEVCAFYRTKNLGMVECCAIDTDTPLVRRGALGTLIPIPDCIVWGAEWKKQ